MDNKEKDKLLFTMEVYEDYEKRFAEARLNKRLRRPWEAKDKEEILKQTKEVLCIENLKPPEIKLTKQGEEIFESYSVDNLMFESFPHTYGSASLYKPKNSVGKKPLILVIPGHGDYGRLTYDVQYLSMRLVKQGAYVLCMDLFGRGERESFGHWNTPGIFATGLSLQGMIILELIGLINYFKKQPYIDANRMGAAGNSGGGTATLFLSGVCNDLSAIASTGYPSEFHYILEKERGHCCCNILPHFANKIEMWEVYSLFAPKPLLLEQGEFDNLIAYDYFARNARKVKTTYKMMDAENNIFIEEAQDKHASSSFDRFFVSDFFAKQFNLSPAQVTVGENGDFCEKEYIDHRKKYITFPLDAVNTESTAEIITNIKIPLGTKLCDTFKPKYKGRVINENEVVEDLGRGNVMKILAQFESCF